MTDVTERPSRLILKGAKDLEIRRPLVTEGVFVEEDRLQLGKKHMEETLGDGHKQISF